MASFRVRSEGGLPVGCLAWLCRQGPTSPCGGSCLRVWWIYLLLPAWGCASSFMSSGRGTGACAQQALRFSLVGTCAWLEQRGHQSLHGAHRVHWTLSSWEQIPLKHGHGLGGAC